jgi:hypothetical protein
MICKQYGITQCAHSLNLLVMCFEKLAWEWFSKLKHVAKFLILITNICCVIDWINYFIIKRNVCRCTCNRCTVITQFAKFAAGEQLCRRCTHRKLWHFKTFKGLSWKKHTSWVVTLLSVGNEQYVERLYLNIFTCPFSSFKWPTWRTIIFSYMFIPILYMFRVLMCSSSGELIVSIRHLVHRFGWSPNPRTRRSPVYSNIYQLLH